MVRYLDRDAIAVDIATANANANATALFKGKADKLEIILGVALHFHSKRA